MRKILFRGKTIGKGVWVYGYYRKGSQTDLIYHLEDSDSCFAVYQETVGQFTGLTDCGGHSLYEHDIVTAKFKSNGSRHNFKIVFEDGAFLFDNGCIAVPFDRIRSAVKIGNIHDNPELLEG